MALARAHVELDRLRADDLSRLRFLPIEGVQVDLITDDCRNQGACCQVKGASVEPLA